MPCNHELLHTLVQTNAVRMAPAIITKYYELPENYKEICKEGYKYIATCVICNKEISSKGTTTSNLHKHITLSKYCYIRMAINI